MINIDTSGNGLCSLMVDLVVRFTVLNPFLIILIGNHIFWDA